MDDHSWIINQISYPGNIMIIISEKKFDKNLNETRICKDWETHNVRKLVSLKWRGNISTYRTPSGHSAWKKSIRNLFLYFLHKTLQQLVKSSGRHSGSKFHYYLDLTIQPYTSKSNIRVELIEYLFVSASK